MKTELDSINRDTIPKFKEELLKNKMPQSQERMYRMHKYQLGMNRQIDLNISEFDTEQNTKEDSQSKENVNKSSMPNHRFSGFRNSMFDISIIKSPLTESSNKKGILPPIKYNFFADEESLKKELEQVKKRRSVMNGQMNCQLKDLDNQFVINLSSFKKNNNYSCSVDKLKNNCSKIKENSNFSIDKKELSNLINDLDNGKIKRCSHFSNFNIIEGKVNEEDNENDSDFNDFDSDCN